MTHPGIVWQKILYIELSKVQLSSLHDLEAFVFGPSQGDVESRIM